MGSSWSGLGPKTDHVTAESRVSPILSKFSNHRPLKCYNYRQLSAKAAELGTQQQMAKSRKAITLLGLARQLVDTNLLIVVDACFPSRLYLGQGGGSCSIEMQYRHQSLLFDHLIVSDLQLVSFVIGLLTVFMCSTYPLTVENSIFLPFYSWCPIRYARSPLFPTPCST